jgi:hypothetical protein
MADRVPHTDGTGVYGEPDRMCLQRAPAAAENPGGITPAGSDQSPAESGPEIFDH